jgi:hypothetical protein
MNLVQDAPADEQDFLGVRGLAPAFPAVAAYVLLVYVRGSIFLIYSIKQDRQKLRMPEELLQAYGGKLRMTEKREQAPALQKLPSAAALQSKPR